MREPEERESEPGEPASGAPAPERSALLEALREHDPYAAGTAETKRAPQAQSAASETKRAASETNDPAPSEERDDDEPALVPPGNRLRVVRGLTIAIPPVLVALV